MASRKLTSIPEISSDLSTSDSKDPVINIGAQGRNLLLKMAAISPSQEVAPPKTMAENVHNKTAAVRSIITRQQLMTDGLKRMRSEIEATEREVDVFLRDFRLKQNHKKYKALEKAEDFVSVLDEYSMEDFI